MLSGGEWHSEILLDTGNHNCCYKGACQRRANYAEKSRGIFNTSSADKMKGRLLELAGAAQVCEISRPLFSYKQCVDSAGIYPVCLYSGKQASANIILCTGQNNNLAALLPFS